MFFSLLSIILVGMVLTIYSGSPYFGALGLVLVSLGVCGVSSFFGFSFLGLILVLTYLGGMLVVFIYSSALASDKYPSVGSWSGSVFILLLMVYYFLMDYFVMSSNQVSLNSYSFFLDNHFMYKDFSEWVVFSFLENLDWGKCGLLYSCFFILLFLVALVLLITLVFVLVMSFGSYNKSLRALM